MAEERTLGLARAQDLTGEEPSKEELQRRLDEARDSISHTVGEIRESVANQVQAVKETLDWREQFKKRPVAWSAGAVGVGFLVGYGLAGIVKGDSDRDRYYDRDRYEETSRSYAAQPILGGHGASTLSAHASSTDVAGYGNGKHEDGPGFFEKLTSTPAYNKVKHEASNIGEALVQEITKTAKTMVIPALITSLRNFIGGHLPNASTSEGQQSQGYYSGVRNESDRTRSGAGSNYQPALERNPS
ncbi:MAG TPA: hypothetical protein VGD38_16630 [Pyrinomonadaceae bacterium]